MPYCVNCGHRLREGDSFCAYCGSPRAIIPSHQQNNEEKRLIVNEGNIHICPSCSAKVNSFQTNCPYCGHEFRDVRPSSALKEFEAKLQRVQTSKLSISERNSEPVKVNYLNPFSVLEAEIQKDHKITGVTQEKLKIIESFPIPNTKEDITEFMILASSNIDPLVLGGLNAGGRSLDNYYNSLELCKAWKVKMDQAYKKAKVSFGNDPDFYKIENIYRETNKEISSKGKLRPMILIGIIVAFLLLFGIFGLFENRKSEKQIEELNNTVEQIQIDIQNEDYDEALIKAHSLHYDATSDYKLKNKWDDQREALIEMIEEKKEESGK